jgi:hypothetical protein
VKGTEQLAWDVNVRVVSIHHYTNVCTFACFVSFCCEVDANSPLIAYYTASGNNLLTFREYTVVFTQNIEYLLNI